MRVMSRFCPTCEWSEASIGDRVCPRCRQPMAIDPMTDYVDVEPGVEVTTHPFHAQRVHNMALDMQASEPRWFWWPYPDSALSLGSYMDVNVGLTEPVPPIPITFGGIPVIVNEDLPPGQMFMLAPPVDEEGRKAKRILESYYDVTARVCPTIHEDEARVSIELGGVSDAQYLRYKHELRTMEERLARAMGLDRYKLFDDPVPEGFRSPLSPLEATKGDRWALPGL